MSAMKMNPCLPIPAKPTPLHFKPQHRTRQKPAKHLHFEPLKHRLLRQADRGRLRDAISTLDLMTQQAIPADLVSYSVLLKSCIRSRNLDAGKLIHRRLLESGLQLDSVVINSLITLYSKCGDWETANSIFEEMGELRDLVSWSAMISCYAHNKMEQESIRLFYRMLESGFYPNQFCFASVIQACSEHLWVGLVIFGFLIKTGFFGSDVCVGSALIDMFARTHDLVSARKVFDEMPEKNLVVWTLMITRYAQLGFGKDAIHLFLDMESDGFEPDRFTLSSIISACTESAFFRFGQQLHARVILSGLTSDVFVGCSLVDMYAKSTLKGSMDDSRKVFDRMTEHNVMSWTAIITGYTQCGGRDKEAVKLFWEMIQGTTIWPNHFTYSSILKACANPSNSVFGEQVFGHVAKLGLTSVNCIGNSLVSMYARSGRMEEARKAFDVLFEKNLISYNAIVDGYVRNSSTQEAFEILYKIDSTEVGVSPFMFASLLSAAASIGAMGKGQQLHARSTKVGFQSDQGVNNALISMYSRCGNIEDACQVFNEMAQRNVISWTSMITGFAKHGNGNRALELFHEMIQAGIKPNEVTYIAVLSACSHVGLVEEGWEHFNSMKIDYGISPSMEHYACMVDLLGRSGLLEEAIKFIGSMLVQADTLIWRTLLGACRIQGNMHLGEEVAKNILRLEPHDPAAYVLLSNLYASTSQWENVAEMRSKMKEMKLTKEAGLSWMEVENTVHEFHVGDTRHPQAREIYSKLDDLASEIKAMGYKPDTNFVLHDVDEELKEQYLFQHSEKIAVAFGLISTSSPRPIRIFKNLRICGDCHTAMKYISKATGREIVLRDSSRFHRIKDGICSCGEYW